jgi:hypothetical protein
MNALDFVVINMRENIVQKKDSNSIMRDSLYPPWRGEGKGYISNQIIQTTREGQIRWKAHQINQSVQKVNWDVALDTVTWRYRNRCYCEGP